MVNEPLTIRIHALGHVSPNFPPEAASAVSMAMATVSDIFSLNDEPK